MSSAYDVVLSELLCKRLLKHPRKSSPTLGYVFGQASKRTIRCVGCAVDNDGVLRSFGYSVVGVFCIYSGLSDNEIYELCHPLVLKYQQEGAMSGGLDVAVVLHTSRDQAAVSTQLVSLEADCPLEPQAVTVVPQVFAEGTCTLRARGSLALPFEMDPQFLQKNLEVAASRVKRSLVADVLAFQLDGTSALMRRSSPEKVLGDLVDQSGDGNRQRRLKATQGVLSFAVLVQSTGEAAAEACGKACTPVIHYQRRAFQGASVALPLDVVATVRVDTPVVEAVDLLAQELANQVDQLVSCMARFSKGASVCSAEPFHFWPAECGHWVTVVYPANTSEDQLLPCRRELHRVLLLPEDRPLFRKANVHAFPEDVASDPYLRNVHLGLSPPAGRDQVRLVSGQYRYRHYQQDRAEDSGWGCAYRSLQTIVSWFQLQGYTDCATPSHREIQQMLVDIGDKPASFVGSRQWIGSQEVGYCLNKLLGVECRTMFVSSGAELSTKSRELLAHFETHGTPVMIGGGMLAHTIIGVAFDSKTGETHYLVLDPHYTGAEDLATVQNKGWCGWKGANFWDRNSFYNLCLPQRPPAI